MKQLLKNKKLLIIVAFLVIATFIVPYLTIPGTFLWWFYKTPKLSKRNKIIATSAIGAIILLLVGWVTVLYAKDVQPHLSVTRPSQTTFSTKASQVTIGGNFSPDDRTVEINGNSISTKNGTFNTTYQLQAGENKITVQAGKWKWAYVYLDITREVPEQKKATPTATPKPIAKTVNSNSTLTKSAQKSTSKPTPTLSPIDQDKQAVKDAVTKVLLADMKLVEGNTKQYPNVNYSEYGINQKEPLIHDITIIGANADLGSKGILSVEFSAIPFPLTVGYYNAAEEATVDILGALQSVKLNTPVNEITVAAFGENKDPFGDPQCQNFKYMRMTFVEVTPNQLSLVTPDQWQDLNGQQEFDKMNSLGIKEETDTYYQACNQTSYEK